MCERRTGAFEGMDFTGFWDDGDYSRDNHTEPPPSDALIAEVEAGLGFRLPDAYVELARMRNGGCVAWCCYPMAQPTSWADDHIAITSIAAIGRGTSNSLLGDLGSPFMQSEWGYPEWGVVFTDNPSAGHDVLMLDYRQCGPQGEPAVVFVDQESDYAVTPVAPDFATFIRGLVSEDEFHDEAEAREEALLTVRRGTLSPLLRRALDAAAAELADGEPLLRALGERIVQAKGHFSLHADEDSQLMYDAVFWLYSQLATAASFENYFNRAEGQDDYARPCHELMLRMDFVAAPYGFNTGGYCEAFVRDWWQARLAAGDIVAVEGGYCFSEAHAAALPARLRQRCGADAR
jgi:hypothetical protein